jgi:putative phosphoesterase
MRLLLLSDVHDHIRHLRRLLENPPACDAVLGCGDWCAPFVIRLLGAGFDRPLHLVWGNNDGDRAGQERLAAGFPHLHLEGEFLDAEFGGRRVFVNHYPGVARAVAAAGTHDLVAYGHDHTAHTERLGRTLLVNPGSVMGYQPAGDRFVTPTVAVYDTETGEAERVALG